VKNKDSMDKRSFFFSLLPFNLWVVLATWLHEELLRKYMTNEFNIYFEENFTMCSYGVEIRRAWCSQKACEICSSLVQKKIEK
jgi:hypothetical protein